MSCSMKYERLIEVTRGILEKFGYTPKAAQITAEILVEADARGVPSHGVARLDFYWKNIQGGFAVPDAEPRIVKETPVSLLVDGANGVGPYVTDFAVRKMLDKAEASGVAFCAVRNSNHYGMAGLWAERAACRDMVGMAFTNTRTCAIPTFGRERILGTNPIAVAIPECGGRSFMIDMATTTVAHGKVEVYDRRKKPMPQGWAVDENGAGMTDATAFEKLFWENPQYGGHLFLGGEGEDLGGHKGYGLGLMVDLLCAGLSMGKWSLHTFEKGSGGSGIAHFFGAFRLDLFAEAEEVKKHVGGILEEVRTSGTAVGHDRIFIAGEKEAEKREESLKNGIFLDDATCETINMFAKKFGVAGV